MNRILTFGKIALLALLVTFTNEQTKAQCTGGSNGGSITPANSWNTVSVRGQYYYSFSAIAGYTYYFSFCGTDGGSSSYDTQITINTNAGAAVPGAYNDDYCGNRSYLEWTCATSGTYRVVTSKNNCNTQSNLGTLAYKYVASCPAGLGTGYTAVASLPYTLASGTTCGKVNDFTSSDITTCGASSFYNGEDMAWSFTPATSGNITVSYNSATTSLLAIYDGCPLIGNSGSCINVQTGTGLKSISFCAQAGVTYYALIDSKTSPGCFAFSNFTISAPTYDAWCINTCPGGLGADFTAVTSLPYTLASGTTCGNENDFNSSRIVSCGTGSYYAGEDMAWSFTPATNGTVTVSYNTTASRNILSVFDACPLSGGGANCVASQEGNGNKSVSFCAQAGVTYYVLIDCQSSTSCFAFTNFTISAPVYNVMCDYTCPGGLGTGYTSVGSLPYNLASGSTCGMNNDITSSRITSCGTASYYDGEDMVWSFTPTSSGSVTVSYSTFASRNNLAIFDACPLNGNSANCVTYQEGNGNKSVTFCAQAGTTYYVVIDCQTATGCFSFTNFNITVPICNTGTGLTNIASLPFSAQYQTTCGAGNDLTSANTPSCGSGSYKAGEDYVYTFTPATSGNIVIRVTSSTNNTGVFLYDGCPLSCGSGGASCVANQTGSSDNTLCVTVTAGTTYYLVVDSWSSCFPYKISISAPSASTAGRTCATPILITSLPYTRYHETTACFGNDYTKTSPGSCGTDYESGEDKVYSLAVASAQCISISISGASTNDIGFQVYKGCPDNASANCIGSAGGALSGVLTGSVTLPSAGVYYIIVDTKADPFNADYNISITNNNTVANDLPCNAINMVFGNYYTGNTNCANGTGEPPVPACWSTPNIVNSVWYSFVAPASGNVTVRTVQGTIISTQIAVYRGTCGTGMTLVDCNTNAPTCGGSPTSVSELSLTGLTSGQTYYVVVDGQGSSTGSFSIFAIESSTPRPDIFAQECNSPIIVCNNDIHVGDPGFQAFGNSCDFPNNSTCLKTAERGSGWYQINVNNTGLLEFSIVPNDWIGAPTTQCTDYDFAIWKIAGTGATNCNGIKAGAAAVRCNYSSKGVTGLYSTSNFNAPPDYPGFANAFNSGINVVAGEVYLLIVSNYTNSSSGFTLKIPASSPVDYTAGSTTVYWTGGEDDNWFNSVNWGGCNVPSCTVNAIIPLSSAYQPNIKSAGASCKSLTVEAGGVLGIDNNQYLTVCGNIYNKGFLDIAPGSGFMLNNPGVNQDMDGNLVAPNRIGNIQINKSSGIVNLKQNMDMQGSLTINGTSSRFDALNKTLTLNGNLTNFAGQFNMGNNGNLILSGPATQNIYDTDTLTNVVVNKPSGNVNLLNNLKIGPTGSLNLLSSKIVTSTYEVQVMNDASSAVSAGNSSSYIEGNLRRNVPSSVSARNYDFPVGNATKGYQRLNLNLYNGINPAVGSIQARFNEFSSVVWSIGLDAPCLVNYGDTMLNNGYWTLTPAGTVNSQANVTLYNTNYTNPKSNYTVGTNPDGLGWIIPPIITGPCVTPPVTAVLRNGVGINFKSGQPFLLGTLQGKPSPLPVELLSFDATAGEHSIFLTWSTASEKNNAGFNLQRSTDGYNFENITWVEGNGTTNNLNNYSFEDKNVKPGVMYYYQLKQVDFNGEFEYSPIRNAKISNRNQVSISAIPNPYQGSTKITYSLPEDGTVVILITDATGRIVKNIDLGNQTSGDYRIPFSAVAEGYAAGLYNVTLYFNDKPYRIKLSEYK